MIPMPQRTTQLMLCERQAMANDQSFRWIRLAPHLDLGGQALLVGKLDGPPLGLEALVISIRFEALQQMCVFDPVI